MKKIIAYSALALSSFILTLSCQKAKINPEKKNENVTSYDFRKDNSIIETFGSIETLDYSKSKTNLAKIIEISKIIKQNIFVIKNLQEILRAHYLPLISNQLEAAGISVKDQNNIFTEGTITHRTSLGGAGPVVNVPACDCNVGSRFSCNTCRSSKSCLDSSDCGFLWMFYCDGLCA